MFFALSIGTTRSKAQKINFRRMMAFWRQSKCWQKKKMAKNKSFFLCFLKGKWSHVSTAEIFGEKTTDELLTIDSNAISSIQIYHQIKSIFSFFIKSFQVAMSAVFLATELRHRMCFGFMNLNFCISRCAFELFLKTENSWVK